MRIAFIRQRYRATGGAERYLASLVAAMASAGHTVHLFANSWTDPPPGVALRRVPVPAGPAFVRILGFAWIAHRMTRRGNFDLIHSFDRTIRPDLYRAGDGCHQAWLDRRRAVEGGLTRSFDRLNPLHRSLLILERHLFQGGCHRIIANSRMVQEEILRYYGAPRSAIQVIYTGVDLDRFRPACGVEGERARFRRSLGVEPDDPVLLFAGSGFERKGLRFLLQAIGRMQGMRGLRVWVLGTGNLHRARTLAHRLGIADRVHFAGPVAEPEAWMTAADLFVLPTIYDPFSNACLEAMACGLPVITTAGNGVAEVLEKWCTGSVIGDPRDVRGLVDHITEFLNPARRKERGAAARACAEAFPAEGHLKQMLATYEDVVKEIQP
ncbi:MAG TPA: glycosyltransferase family 4 protein [Candidatus Acidoferrum sp.]|nr:glycosyltransferase family 4 protein [Candidatus Acidoferrum sp.]